MEVLIIVIAGIIVLTLCTKVLKKNTNSTVITFKSTNGEIPENMKEMMEKNFQNMFENAPEGFKDKFNSDDTNMIIEQLKKLLNFLIKKVYFLRL